MPPIEPPKRATLIPNTQHIYCHFQTFCRGGLAQYLLARGPALGLRVPLCATCAEDMMRQAPDRLIRVAVEGALERGRGRMVQLGLGAPETVELDDAVDAGALAALAVAPGVVMTPVPPAPLSEGDVLAYIREHAEDPDLLDAITGIMGGNTEDLEGDPPPDPPPEGAQPPGGQTKQSQAAPRKPAVRKSGKKPTGKSGKGK